MQKRILIFIAALFVGFLLWRLVPATDQGSDESIKIGGAFSFTGFSEEWGVPSRNGVMLAIEDLNKSGGINGKKMVLVEEDTKGTEIGSVGAVHKLADVDSVKFIIGPTWLDGFGGPRPLSDNGKLLMIAPDSLAAGIQRDHAFPYIFTTWYRADKEMQALAKEIALDGMKKVEMFTVKDDFFTELNKNLKNSLIEENISVGELHELASETSDFRTDLLKAKQSGVDAAFFGFDGEKSLLSFLKQRRELFPELRLYASESVSSFIGQEDFKELTNGVKFVSPADPDNGWKARYKARFGTEPIFSASNSYDAVMVLAKALRVGAKTPQEVREYFLSSTFDTVTFGNIGFDKQGGIDGGSFVIKKVVNNAAELVQ